MQWRGALSALVFALVPPAAAAQVLPVPFASPAPSNNGIEQSGIFETAPVTLDGAVLFRVVEPLSAGPVPITDRANTIETALQEVVAPVTLDGRDTTAYDPATLKVVLRSENGQTVLVATDARHHDPLTLLTVTANDAQYYGDTAADLGTQWQSVLQDALVRALQKRQPATMRQHVTVVEEVGAVLFIFTVLMAFLSAALTRRLERIRRDEERRRSQEERDARGPGAPGSPHQQRRRLLRFAPRAARGDRLRAAAAVVRRARVGTFAVPGNHAVRANARTRRDRDPRHVGARRGDEPSARFRDRARLERLGARSARRRLGALAAAGADDRARTLRLQSVRDRLSRRAGDARRSRDPGRLGRHHRRPDRGRHLAGRAELRPRLPQRVPRALRGPVRDGRLRNDQRDDRARRAAHAADGAGARRRRQPRHRPAQLRDERDQPFAQLVARRLPDLARSERRRVPRDGAAPRDARRDREGSRLARRGADPGGMDGDRGLHLDLDVPARQREDRAPPAVRAAARDQRAGAPRLRGRKDRLRAADRAGAGPAGLSAAHGFPLPPAAPKTWPVE